MVSLPVAVNAPAAMLVYSVCAAPWCCFLCAAVQSLSGDIAEPNLVGLLVRGVVPDHDPRHQLLHRYHAVLQACQQTRGLPLCRLFRFCFPVQPAGAHLV